MSEKIDAYTSALSGEGATTRKVALADVLWTAANEHLEAPEQPWHIDGVWSASCCAVASALGINWARHGLHYEAERSPVFKFLNELGCDTHSHLLCYAGDRQGSRYMWLLLAMHCAEDEGIQIEVPA
jgi:hypothetical protein